MPISRIPPSELRWRLDPKQLTRASPAEAPDSAARKRLITALRAALAGADTRRCNIFILGDSGTERRKVLEQALDDLGEMEGMHEDYCYVHNFEQPDSPRLLRLAAGEARVLEIELRDLSRFIRDELEGALQSRPIRNRLQALDDRTDTEMRKVSAPLEKTLKPHGLVLVREQVGQLVRLTIHVQQTGRVITQDDLANLVAKGQVSAEEFETIRQVVREVQPELREITQEINVIWKNSRQLGQRLLRAEARRLLADLSQSLFDQIDDPEVRHQMDCIIADVMEKRIDRNVEYLADPELLYSANTVYRAHENALPVEYESRPTPRNLVGTIDPSWLESGRSVASFRGIRGGSLLRAHGGFLVIEAGSLLDQSDSIAVLRRALAQGSLAVETNGGTVHASVSLRPEPLPMNARLVLIGDAEEWSELQSRHPGFARMFRRPVEIPDAVSRTPTQIAWLAESLTAIANRLELPPPSPEALTALIEHAARLAGPGRLSVRTRLLGDVMRDAAVFSREEDDSTLSAAHVHRAVHERRPPLPRADARNDTIKRFPMRQHQVGQVHLGALVRQDDARRGQVLRVQAAIARADTCRIEFTGSDTSALPGAGTMVEILLSRLLHLDKPAHYHAVIGIECDSDAEVRAEPSSLALAALLALISRLSGVPLRQDLLVVASVDLEARLMPVRGLNEQIEDACRVVARASDGINAGVIMPAAQRPSLMLAADVLQAAENELFQIFAAGNLTQSLELLAGAGPGAWRDKGFPDGSLMATARSRLSKGEFFA